MNDEAVFHCLCIMIVCLISLKLKEWAAAKHTFFLFRVIRIKLLESENDISNSFRTSPVQF